MISTIICTSARVDTSFPLTNIWIVEETQIVDSQRAATFKIASLVHCAVHLLTWIIPNEKLAEV
jgi:hypothetical protein